MLGRKLAPALLVLAGATGLLAQDTGTSPEVPVVGTEAPQVARVLTDRLGDRIIAFGPGWSFLGVLGQTGSDPGSWRRPGVVAVGGRGPFLVVDEGNRRIVLLDTLGEVIAARDFAAASDIEVAKGIEGLAEFAAQGGNSLDGFYKRGRGQNL